jgi:DNA-binding SARP family transcriptional activator
LGGTFTPMQVRGIVDLIQGKTNRRLLGWGAAIFGTGSDYHIQLLGQFGVTYGDRSISLGPSSERLVALLACLVRPVSRHRAAGLLWPDRPESRAKANLRSVIYRMSSYRGLVISSSRQVGLGPSTRVDFQITAALAQQIIAGSIKDLPRPDRDALTRDLLPCWYEDDWVIEEREAFKQNRLHALEVLCLMLAQRGRYGEAIDAAFSVVRTEPLRESAHRALVMVHLCEGNYGEALRQYERCRILLHDELGIDPSPRLHDLIFGSPQKAPRSCDAAVTGLGGPHIDRNFSR